MALRHIRGGSSFAVSNRTGRIFNLKTARVSIVVQRGKDTTYSREEIWDMATILKAEFERTCWKPKFIEFEADRKPNSIYIAGPMTGLPCFNHHAFYAAAHKLRAEDPTRHVHSPAEVTPIGDDQSWEMWMREGIGELVKCESIYMLKGWDRSRGATLEWHIANQLKMTVLYQ